MKPPPYHIDGRIYRSVAGLCTYLVQKHGPGSEISAIQNGVLLVFAEHSRTVIATYSVAYLSDRIQLIATTGVRRHRVDDFERDDDDDLERDEFDRSEFAEPGGNSALRAATKDNPRNLPCPTCGAPNRLTPKDKALGYQCNACADRAEGTYSGGDY